MRIRWAILSVALLVGGCEAPEIENSQSALKYDPPAPFATQCNCTNTHGTCSADCSTIQCDSGYADCDGILSNGCEIETNTSPTHCGSCTNDCTICLTGASCVAGSCSGHPVPSCVVDMSNNSGMNPSPDMSHPDGGHGGCDFTGGGVATAWALLLLGTVALLARRRREQ